MKFSLGLGLDGHSGIAFIGDNHGMDHGIKSLRGLDHHGALGVRLVRATLSTIFDDAGGVLHVTGEVFEGGLLVGGHSVVSLFTAYADTCRGGALQRQ